MNYWEKSVLVVGFISLVFIQPIYTQSDLHYKKLSEEPSLTLTEIQLDAYQQRAVQKVKDFTNYLELLVDKEHDYKIRNHSIQTALNLFEEDQNYIEVVSTSKKLIRQYPAYTYLRRVLGSSYDQVFIENQDIQLETPFELSEDGNYYGSVSSTQFFQGYKNENDRTYADYTTKSFGIALKLVEKSFGPKILPTWQLFLTDIEIVSVSNVEKTVSYAINKNLDFFSLENILKKEAIIDQYLSQKNQELSQRKEAIKGNSQQLINWYSQSSQELLTTWNNALQNVDLSQSQLNSMVTAQRLGDVQQHLEIKLQLSFTNYLPNSQTLIKDQKQAYQSPDSHFHLVAFKKLINAYQKLLGENPQKNINIIGYSKMGTNLSNVKYGGELGSNLQHSFISLVNSQEKQANIFEGQSVSLENLAFLRAYKAKSVMDDLAETRFSLQTQYSTADNIPLMVEIKVMMENLYLKEFENLPQEEQQQLMNSGE